MVLNGDPYISLSLIWDSKAFSVAPQSFKKIYETESKNIGDNFLKLFALGTKMILQRVLLGKIWSLTFFH